MNLFFGLHRKVDLPTHWWNKELHNLLLLLLNQDRVNTNVPGHLTCQQHSTFQHLWTLKSHQGCEWTTCRDDMWMKWTQRTEELGKPTTDTKHLLKQCLSTDEVDTVGWKPSIWGTSSHPVKSNRTSKIKRHCSVKDDCLILAQLLLKSSFPHASGDEWSHD